MEIGAQLYTVRSACQTPEDFALSLQKVAAIGYKTVQVSGTCDYEAGWLASELKKNGLRCVLTHIPADRLTADAAAVAKAHGVFGCHYVGLGYTPFHPDEAAAETAAFAEAFRPVAQTLLAGGRYFMYHNHDQEFIRFGGRTVLEHLAEAIPAEEMGFTLDTFWVQAGGGDPARWLERLSGRVPCVHLKDYGYGREMKALGEGNIDFDRVLEKAEAAGTAYLLVEQDDCGGEDPFACLQRSYDYLKAMGLS